MSKTSNGYATEVHDLTMKLEVSEHLRRELEAEVARLRELLRRYRDGIPLGHQPHMIAHEVDAALQGDE